jgi:hypothetical protein
MFGLVSQQIITLSAEVPPILEQLTTLQEVPHPAGLVCVDYSRPSFETQNDKLKPLLRGDITL